ncbi:MAG: hypothetical protein H0V82_05510 [Candidatus Protochlamydia sp.]|nr:hypothetical protein [Candidatus Protochlamydia sp.]
MLYITGENETLNDLKEKECFKGSLTDYTHKFNELNQILGLKIAGPAYQLPRYTPLFPVSQPSPVTLWQHESAQIIGTYSIKERGILREAQEQGIEIPATMAAEDFLSDYESTLRAIRSKIDHPLIQTPWKFTNDLLTLEGITSIGSETSSFRAKAILNSSLFKGLNELEKNMLTMEALHTQLHAMKGEKSVNALKIKEQLKTQINALAPKIKNQIIPKIEDKLSKHLHSRFSFDELRKMSRTFFDEKLARKGLIKTTYFDLVNRSGLAKMRESIPKFENIGENMGKFSTLLAYAPVVYDTSMAADRKEYTQAVRTAVVGTVKIETNMAVTAIIIGTVGSVFLASNPVGWSLVVGGGVIVYAGLDVGNQAGNLSEKIAGGIFDGTINLINKNPKIGKAFSDFFRTNAPLPGSADIGRYKYEELMRQPNMQGWSGLGR